MDDIFRDYIACYLDLNDLLALRLVNKEWNKMVDDLIDIKPVFIPNKCCMNIKQAKYFLTKKHGNVNLIIPNDVQTVKYVVNYCLENSKYLYKNNLSYVVLIIESGNLEDLKWIAIFFDIDIFSIIYCKHIETADYIWNSIERRYHYLIISLIKDIFSSGNSMLATWLYDKLSIPNRLDYQPSQDQMLYYKFFSVACSNANMDMINWYVKTYHSLYNKQPKYPNISDGYILDSDKYLELLKWLQKNYPGKFKSFPMSKFPRLIKKSRINIFKWLLEIKNKGKINIPRNDINHYCKYILENPTREEIDILLQIYPNIKFKKNKFLSEFTFKESYSDFCRL